MMKKVIFICLVIIQSSTCVDYDGWLNIKIMHTLSCNNDNFCNRGNIMLKSLRSGLATVDQIPLTKYDVEELRKIAKDDGFYTIKSIVTSGDNRESEFLSSVKAQTFLDSGLSDIINAWVMPNGAMVAITFQVTNSSNPLNLSKDEFDINSNFYLRHVEQAPVPDTASYIQKLEREREAREKGEVKDNRSFLSKYWMYIVPIAIFVMISGAANPEAASGAR